MVKGFTFLTLMPYDSQQAQKCRSWCCWSLQGGHRVPLRLVVGCVHNCKMDFLVLSVGALQAVLTGVESLPVGMELVLQSCSSFPRRHLYFGVSFLCLCCLARGTMLLVHRCLLILPQDSSNNHNEFLPWEAPSERRWPAEGPAREPCLHQPRCAQW